MKDRVVGILLFLPVPFVLWLFTRAPVGVAASIVIGVAVMATHRLYARRWALRRSERRCLWCGGATVDGIEVPVDEPPGPTTWTACRESHAERVTRVLSFAQSWSVALRVGILGGLVVFLPAAVLAGRGRLGAITYLDAVAGFKLAVAVAVLPLGWLGPRSRASYTVPIRIPFPVHIQALIGTWAVMWLFRIVGLIWLAQAGFHAAHTL